MAETLIAFCRFLEFVGAVVLFGSPLLLLYGSPVPASANDTDLRWTKLLLSWAAFTVLAATASGFIAQTSNLAGSLALAIQPESLEAALWEMDFGRSSLIRAGSALLVLIAIMLLPAGKRLWRVCAALGTVTCASFAWMGHGAATEGTLGMLHLAGDIAHTLAAAGWIGALVVFSILLIRPIQDTSAQKALYSSLAFFSGVGTVFVAVIIASGLINSAFLVGWNLEQIVSAPYGQVLIVKLILFALMLTLAVRNRFRHTPALANALQSLASSQQAIADLRRSIIQETSLAVAVLALVGWLGMLEPVTS